jgi:hypothetical protein
MDQLITMAAVENNRSPETSSDAPDPGRRAGRGRKDAEPTVQVSLRLPASQVNALRELAFAAGRAEKCMITPQEIVRRMIAAALHTDRLPVPDNAC